MSVNYRGSAVDLQCPPHTPVCVSLVDDPDLVPDILSLQEAVYVWNKLYHLLIAIPEWYYHC